MKKWQAKRKKNKEAQMEYFEKHPYCEICGKKSLQVHEIVFRSHGGECEKSNMLSVCLECHEKCHFLRKPWLTKKELLEAKYGCNS